MKTTEKTSKVLPTLKELVEKYEGDVRQGIKEIRDLTIPNKYAGGKPHLKRDHTVQEAKEYTTALEVYEKEKEENKAYNETIAEHNRNVNYLAEEFVKEVSGLNSTVPPQYREKVWSRASQEGHSEGLPGIYNQLLDLIDIFE